MQLKAMKQHIQHQIQKFTEGQLSLKEQLELADQLADGQNRLAEEVLNQDWQEKLVSENNSDRDLKPILDRVHHQIRLNETKDKPQLNWWLSFQRIAAIIIFPLLLGFLAYVWWPAKQVASPVSYAEIQCPLGVRTKFQLPDGSTGFLNSGSRLKYPVTFIGERKVELLGEAYFDVVHNAEIPFHVNTPNLDIKVLGTTFNVIANENEPTEEIVLQTGKVDVSDLNGKQLAVLKPDEQITLDIKNQTYQQNKVEATQYTSWKEGKLVFRNENMQQVARRLSRWYNAEVVVDSRQLDDYTFHATFMDEPLDEVLKLLAFTTPLSYHEEKRTSSASGIFEKRKITLRINPNKIKQFR